MLNVEYLKCKNKKFHKDCQWVHAKLQYPNGQYLLLKDRIIREVKRTRTAYRITHWKFGVLVTVKMGHDGNIWVGEDKGALRRFALYGGD